MNKKGNLAAVVILLLIVVGIIVVVNYSMYDCTSNRDCQKEEYCGADNECHQYPNKIVIRQNSFVWASLILGICLIITAFVFRKGRLPFVK